MTSSSSWFVAVFALAWFGIGLYAVVTALQHRPDVARVRLIVGVVMIAVGAWNAYVRLQ